MAKPTIRFRGFDDEWEQRKLGELGTVQTCKRIFKEQTSEQGDIPFFKNGTIGLEPDSYISREVYEEFRRLYPYPEVGDTLISVVGSIGRTAEYTGKDEYFQDSNVVWLKTDGSINKKFLKIAYQVIKWLIEGSTVKHLYNDNILRSEIVMPVSQIEQAKIAEFFEALDHLITLHQRKCDETKKLKKYMLQKMFPQNGSKVPEIRFKGFTDEWEQRKLIEVCDYVDYRGKTPTKTEDGIFLVTAKNVKDGFIDYETSKEYISENAYEEVMRRGKPEIGDVLITTEAPCGNVAQVNKADIALAQRIIKYRGHIGVVDNTYLKYYLLSPEFQKILNAKSSGGTVQGIKGSILHQQKIIYPSYEEQKKIGQHMDSLDNLITLHQHKCEELKKLKKFMLQNMFI